jgi:hypothetical protein
MCIIATRQAHVIAQLERACWTGTPGWPQHAGLQQSAPLKKECYTHKGEPQKHAPKHEGSWQMTTQ